MAQMKIGFFSVIARRWASSSDVLHGIVRHSSSAAGCSCLCNWRNRCSVRTSSAKLKETKLDNRMVVVSARAERYERYKGWLLEQVTLVDLFICLLQ